jgi:thioredoxin-dependent peroxiredoxin
MKVGDVAPNFILKDQNGKEFELYKNLDKKLLIVFYPKDNTVVCSSQLAEYNESLDEFISNGINVVGINADSIHSHLNFCSKLKLKFPLLADEDKKVSKQFNAINFLGMNKRLLVLINIDKRVLWTESTLPVTYIKAGEILGRAKSSV